MLLRNPTLHLWAEMLDKALNRPRRCVAERADGMAFDLFGDFIQHVDLGRRRITGAHAFHHTPHPACAFTAGRALAAAFMLVEIGQARNGADDVGGLVHYDDGRSAKTGADFLTAVEIHRHVHHHGRRNQRNGRSAGDYREQIVPPAAHAAAMLFDQLTERNAHRLFDDAGFFDMARNLEKFRAMVVFTAKAFEPRGTAPQDGRNHRDALHIIHGRRAAIKTSACREWRFQARLAFFAFQTFNHRGFFAANIGARAAMDEDVKIIARFGGIFAKQTGGIRLGHSLFENLGFENILATNVDIGGACAHCETGDQRTFD